MAQAKRTRPTVRSKVEPGVEQTKTRNSGDDSADGWVTLKVAAEAAGVSVSTLRNWYRKNLIESRTEQGPNGVQRLVRKSEVQKRAGVPAGDAEAVPDSDLKSGNDLAERLEAAIKALPDMIGELAEARERAGRAEAKVESLSDQLAEQESRREELGAIRTELEQENRILEQRLARLQSQAEQLARRLAAAERAHAVGPDEIEEVAAASLTPEEEDEYLALTQRWRARRKRKKAERKEERLQKRLDRLS